MEKYDVIVIGAGPAGCFAATELRRKGYSVCILEKEEKGHRKVCGDGLSMAGMEVLKLMDFPVERISEKGFRIDQYYYYVNNECIKKEITKPAYCLARNMTDELFQDYASNDFHISIIYGNEVKHIFRTEDGYDINGISCKKVIVACGANAQIQLDNKPFISIDSGKPFGVSCVLKGKKRDKGFFLFDYDEKYNGTYAWIFTLGNDLYNVGLWRKTEYSKLKRQLEDFIKKRCGEWIGESYEIVKPVKGAFMGIGSPLESREDGILFAGDMANSSNEMDGEGISRAIISAKRTIEKCF